MSSKKRIIAGLVCAVLSVSLVLGYASQVRSEAKQQRDQALAAYGGEQVEVCVATADISPGQAITTSNVEVQTWLSSLLPQNCVTDIDDVLGQKVGQTVLANEPLSYERMESADAQLVVPDGLCAVTVEADSITAVGGAVSSGQLVNVYSVSETGSQLLGEDLLVLQTSAQGSSEGIDWVTLAVTAESVQQLLDAARLTTLSFVLPGKENDVEGQVG